MKNQDAAVYSGRMKLADVISSDPTLLSILERLDIKLGFGDATVNEICASYGLSLELFLMICNINSFDNYLPVADSLKRDDASRIISYLRTSHKYYTQRYFPHLHSNIHKMMEACSPVENQVLNKFYDEYDAEVDKHFSYEETVVFPYIEALMQGKKSDYSIEKFQESHSDLDEKLCDFKNIIIKYLPEADSSHIRFIVLQDIFMIEKDLHKHTLIENKLLIPLVAKMEKNG